MAISKTGRMSVIFNRTELFSQLLFRHILGCVLFISLSLPSNSQISSPLKSNTSKWVFYNSKGILEYKTTEKGDRIMDFSYAGYESGGIKLPEVPEKITVLPTGGDDTENIQNAINKVSEMPFNGKFRGAVLLGAGEFNISKTLTISVSGVVLRGSGSGLFGEKISTLKLSGKPFNAISVRLPFNRGNRNSETEKESRIQTKISDKYVPAGTTIFSIEDAGKFMVGDQIAIRKPVTESWIKFMQMDDLVRDGKPQTWLAAGSDLVTERKIIQISKNTVTIDVPLSDSYNSAFLNPPGVIVEKVNIQRLKQCGVEHLHIVSPLQAISHEERHFTALRIDGEDCWAKDIFIEETMNSVGVGGQRITVEDVTVSRKALHQGSSRPAEFAPNGSQVLVNRCKVIADNVWFMATGKGISGPIVVLNCDFIGDRRAETHQRWSTGMLYDNVRAKTGGIDIRNRGSMGSGHGWSMGWAVAWNCEAKDYTIQNPPGSCNWMIGCIGESLLQPRPFGTEPKLPEGIVDSQGIHVNPASLYLAQLKERLGKKALENIGYE